MLASIAEKVGSGSRLLALLRYFSLALCSGLGRDERKKFLSACLSRADEGWFPIPQLQARP